MLNDCKQCSGEMPGYNTNCLDCCARLVMSTGRKNGEPSRDQCITRQRNSMFDSIERSGSKLKRMEIVEHIKAIELRNSENNQVDGL